MEVINANTDEKKPDIFTLFQDIANIGSSGDFSHMDGGHSPSSTGSKSSRQDFGNVLGCDT